MTKGESMSAVFKKLNLKDQKEILVLNAPESFEPEIKSLRKVKVHRTLQGAKGITFSIAFVTRQKELDRIARSLSRKAEGDPIVWFAYPKKTSRNYQCEFNRDTGWVVLGEAGFEGVRMVAIDADWSALRFRRVEFIKTMTRESKRALTREGRKKAAAKQSR